MIRRDLIDEAFNAAGRLAKLASAVQSLEDFGLSSQQQVEFEVLLRQGLSEVANRISEMLSVGVDAAAPGAAGRTPGSERVVESLVDVHSSSSRVPAQMLDTSESFTGTLGDAADPRADDLGIHGASISRLHAASSPTG